ncbi:MAG: CCA tRNA nucleotidyltransferase [Desulfobacterales bacterium]|nr:CCA tRNA nucleotidyltransferase [Desulfobacterales bacterium]MBS3754557.1 CCA tRNA nucleotidyltransferase [Desulfobacterales bacterium]
MGGTVRDRMLGRPTADYDLAVTGDPAGVAESIAAAAGRRVVVMGRPGQCVYRIVAGAETYDVSAIQGKDITADLLRRDFTINAMGLHVKTEEIIDPACGRKDLADRLVRMVAPGVFDADPLRLLRAFRMAAVLEFSVERRTLAAIVRRPQKIAGIAGERIREEWRKLLETPDSTELLWQMHQSGLLESLIPELGELRGCTQNPHHRADAFEHTMQVCQGLEQMLHQNAPTLSPDRENRDLPADPENLSLIKHAALIHDLGKPRCKTADEHGGIHFYGHETEGAEMAREINRRMRFSNADNKYVVFLVKNHLRPLFLYLLHQQAKLRPETVSRFFMKTAPWTPDLLLLAAADMAGKKESGDSGFTEFARTLLAGYANEHLPAARRSPLITGRDLIDEFGLSPSPQFARILRQVEEKRLAGSLENREQALAFVKKEIEKPRE